MACDASGTLNLFLYLLDNVRFFIAPAHQISKRVILLQPHLFVQWPLSPCQSGPLANTQASRHLRKGLEQCRSHQVMTLQGHAYAGLCKHQNTVFVAGLMPGESGAKEEEIAASVIQRASALGVTLINTADKLTDAGPWGAQLTAGFSPHTCAAVWPAEAPFTRGIHLLSCCTALCLAHSVTCASASPSALTSVHTLLHPGLTTLHTSARKALMDAALLSHVLSLLCSTFLRWWCQSNTDR